MSQTARERGKRERRGRREGKYWAGESTIHPSYKTYITIKKRKYKGSHFGTFLQFQHQEAEATLASVRTCSAEKGGDHYLVYWEGEGGVQVVSRVAAGNRCKNLGLEIKVKNCRVFFPDFQHQRRGDERTEQQP